MKKILLILSLCTVIFGSTLQAHAQTANYDIEIAPLSCDLTFDPLPEDVEDIREALAHEDVGPDQQIYLLLAAILLNVDLGTFECDGNNYDGSTFYTTTPPADDGQPCPDGFDKIDVPPVINPDIFRRDPDAPPHPGYICVRNKKPGIEVIGRPPNGHGFDLIFECDEEGPNPGDPCQKYKIKWGLLTFGILQINCFAPHYCEYRLLLKDFELLKYIFIADEDGNMRICIQAYDPADNDYHNNCYPVPPTDYCKYASLPGFPRGFCVPELLPIPIENPDRLPHDAQ